MIQYNNSTKLLYRGQIQLLCVQAYEHTVKSRT